MLTKDANRMMNDDEVVSGEELQASSAQQQVIECQLSETKKKTQENMAQMYHIILT